MAYTHNQGFSSTTKGFAVGAKGSEVQVISQAGVLYSAGAKVASGTQQVHVVNPTGGTTTDAEARTAINAILVALETFGINASS
jgi:hypothetical protein